MGLSHKYWLKYVITNEATWSCLSHATKTEEKGEEREDQANRNSRRATEIIKQHAYTRGKLGVANLYNLKILIPNTTIETFGNPRVVVAPVTLGPSLYETISVIGYREKESVIGYKIEIATITDLSRS